MNNQNILKYRGTKLDGILDYSELYDYELVDTEVEVAVDFSELYDYKLGNFEKDYVLVEKFPITVVGLKTNI
jgi:hypothetical protein